MKEHALAIARGQDGLQMRLNLLREYLQAFALRSLHESEAFSAIAFVGGTALRFIRQLPRFSEDLDFSVYSPALYDGIEWMRKLKCDYTAAGFDVSVNWKQQKAVHTGWIRFGGLLRETGLSAHASEKLSIKVEVDANPPAGAVIEKRVITRDVTFMVSHYDLPSLMAGKLHALVARPYVKGRDWYDLLWYLSSVPPVVPNETLLQNALDQTQGKGTYRAGDWRSILLKKLDALPFERVAQDVVPFLERAEDAKLLSVPNLKLLLRQGGYP